MVRTKFLEEHPEVVKQLLEGQVQADRLRQREPRRRPDGRQRPRSRSSRPRSSATTVIAAAWKNLTFTDDPIASSLEKSADDAQSLGLLETRGDLPGCTT